MSDDGTRAEPPHWARGSGLEVLRRLSHPDAPMAPHAKLLSLKIQEAEPGRVTLLWTPTAALANPAGPVHGGFIAGVCDDAAVLACASLGDRFVPQLTLDMHVEYIRTARAGETYLAVGTVAHHGGQRTIADAVITHAEAGLIARAHLTCVPNRAFPGAGRG